MTSIDPSFVHHPPVLAYESPQTRREDRLRKEFFNPARALSLLLALLIPIVVIGMNPDDPTSWVCYKFFFFPAAALLAMRFVLKLLKLLPQKFVANDRYWGWIFWVLLLWTVGSIRYDRCPHAKYWAIGPYTFVTEGTACGNARCYKSVVIYPFDR